MMRTKIRSCALAYAVTLTFLSACAVIPKHEPHLGTDQITSKTLMTAAPLRDGTELEDLSRIDVLEITPGMLEFIDEHIKPHQSDYARLRRLLHAVMGEGEFDLVYDETTRTASETFDKRRGNCLSFTNMFIAMARKVGINAQYQEVEIQPLWSMSGSSFRINQHVNVHVDLGPGRTRVVDFNIRDFNTEREQRIISDARARAHYFNNIGVEKMLAENTQSALANFRQSLLEDRSFTAAWINFGSLYRRGGNADYAEAAFLRALYYDPSSMVAMSNLAELYQEQGETALANDYEARVKLHRQRNPYYWFYLANEAFTDGDYDGAIDHVERALRLHDREPRFYSLLSFSYLMNGNREAARRWMEHAESLVEDEADKSRYREKLDMLVSQDSKD